MSIDYKILITKMNKNIDKALVTEGKYNAPSICNSAEQTCELLKTFGLIENDKPGYADNPDKILNQSRKKLAKMLKNEIINANIEQKNKEGVEDWKNFANIEVNDTFGCDVYFKNLYFNLFKPKIFNTIEQQYSPKIEQRNGEL